MRVQRDFLCHERMRALGLVKGSRYDEQVIVKPVSLRSELDISRD